jgi:integrase
MSVRIRFYRGSWWVFVAHHGRRRSKRVGDRATALLVARKIREKLALGDLSLVSDDAQTLESYAEAWLRDGEGARKASTHRFYAFNLKLHILPVLGARRLASISRADCRQLVATCREKGLKVASLYGVQRTLSGVLSQAVEDEILTANPAFRMGKYLRQGDEPRREIHPLTREEAQTFLEVIRDHSPEHEAFFLCALRTGMRLGELLGLQWADVDLAGRFIEVQRNIVGGAVTTPKNSKRRRVDLSRQLAETLAARLREAKAAMLKAGSDQLCPWVFPNREGQPLDGDNLRRRVFHVALVKAKLRQIRIHDLRHTFASLLIQQGESLAYVRDQMGHSSIQVTVDVYGHLVPGSNRAAVDRLDDASFCIPAASDADAREVRNEETGELLRENGAGDQTRTDDLLITNQLLYQLSYAGPGGVVLCGQRRPHNRTILTRQRPGLCKSPAMGSGERSHPASRPRAASQAERHDLSSRFRWRGAPSFSRVLRSDLGCTRSVSPLS